MTTNSTAPSNPPAFPFAAEYGHPGACGGMSLRDWFAGQAVRDAYETAISSVEPEVGNGAHILRTAAIVAYQFADAMLAERERQP